VTAVAAGKIGKRHGRGYSGRLPATSSVTVLLAVLFFVSPPVGYAQAAAEADVTEGWVCALCVGTPGWLVDFDAGPAALLDDAFPLGDYRGLDAEGGYLFGNLLGRYRDEQGRFSILEGYTRSGDAYGLFAEGGRQGAWRARVSLQSIPRRFLDQTRTPFRDAGTADLKLPSDWLRAPTTDAMTTLPAAAAPVELGYERRRFGLGLDWNVRRNLELNVDFRRQERDGLVRSSGAMLFSSLEFASPIDYATDDVEVGLSYSKDNWQASASYFGSVFENSNDSVTWDNPYTAVYATSRGQQAQPPDNEAHRVTVAGAVLLPARTTVNGHVSVGRLTQDARLLPYTTSPGLSAALLPSTTADAEVDTVSFNLRAVSSPWARLTLEGELRVNDFDNSTPIRAWDYVVTDALPGSQPVTNTAWDYERREIRLRGEYRAASRTRISFGADTERFERSFQDRRRTTTDRVWARLTLRPGGVSELLVDFFSESRDGTSYETVLDPAAPENPLMRKYNMSDRERNGVKLRGTYLGSDRADFGVELEVSADRYDKTVLGLTDDDYRRIGADFSYVLGDAGSVFASVYNEQIEAIQANSQTFSLPDWAATTRDEFTTATLGAAYPGLFGRIDAELEFSWSRSKGSIDKETGGLSSDFPDLRARRRTARLGVSYPFSRTLKLGLDYFVEKFSSDDWAFDGVDLATVPSLLSLGAAAWNYQADVVYLSVQYRLTR
jgi:MtrB/PioB family decaheme-associated outer membrane protein